MISIGGLLEMRRGRSPTGVPSKDGPPADLYLCSFNWNQNRIADWLQVNRNDLYHWQIITHLFSCGEL